MVNTNQTEVKEVAWRNSWVNVLTVALTETIIFSLALISSGFLFRFVNDIGLFFKALVLYACVMGWTLIALKLIRQLFPLKPGVYHYHRNPGTWRNYNLYQFLCHANLGLFYSSPLLPAPLRTLFYKLLGANIGKGIIIVGQLRVPQLITLEDNVMIGEDALLLGEVITSISASAGDVLVLGKIEIKKNALIGARTLVMPGVTVGENSVINTMSFVPLNTKIPANEIWGGNPAKKVGEIPQRKAEQSPAVEPIFKEVF